jgi:hypothetical protein
MLETLKQQGREKLDEAGEANTARDRHLAFFLAFAETAKPHLRVVRASRP